MKHENYAAYAMKEGNHALSQVSQDTVCAGLVEITSCVDALFLMVRRPCLYMLWLRSHVT